MSLIGAYFLFGFLYMRLVVNARGWEQIPNYSFWRSIFLTLKVRFPPFLSLLLTMPS